MKKRRYFSCGLSLALGLPDLTKKSAVVKLARCDFRVMKKYTLALAGFVCVSGFALKPSAYAQSPQPQEAGELSSSPHNELFVRPRVGYSSWSKLSPVNGGMSFGGDIGMIMPNGVSVSASYLTGSNRAGLPTTTGANFAGTYEVRVNSMTVNPGYTVLGKSGRMTFFASVGSIGVVAKTTPTASSPTLQEQGVTEISTSRLALGGGIAADFMLSDLLFGSVVIQNLTATDDGAKINVLSANAGLGIRF